MSVETSPSTSLQSVWAAQDDIDLIAYVRILARSWRTFLGTALAVAVIIVAWYLVVQTTQADVYESAARVAIVRTVSDVTFDPKFRTLSQDMADVGTISAASRKAALIELVNNGAIAEAVAAELGNILEPDLQIPANLLEMISATSGSGWGADSDLITITALADTPAKATLLAGVWAKHYVEHVNSVYGQVPNALVASVAAEVTQAEKQYREAQTVLEEHIGSSHADELQELVDEKQVIIDKLQEGRSAAVAALVSETVSTGQEALDAYLSAIAIGEQAAFAVEQEGKAELLSGYLGELNNARLSVFQEQALDNRQMLAVYYGERRLLTQIVQDATALRRQIEVGGEGAVQSSATALQLLKLQAFAQQDTSMVGRESASEGSEASNDLPAGNGAELQLSIQSPQDVSVEALLADVDGVIDAVNGRLASVEEQINTLSELMIRGSGYSFAGAQAPTDGELVEAVRTQYPELFEIGELSALGKTLAEDSTLVQVAEEQAAELIHLGELADMVDEMSQEDAVGTAIRQLIVEARMLKSELAAETARGQELTQQRDLAWETLKTLNSKVAELTLARAAASSEVRLAAPAVTPTQPVAGVSLLTIALVAVAGGVAAGLAVIVVMALLHVQPSIRQKSWDGLAGAATQ